MDAASLSQNALTHLHTLCVEITSRRVGSQGNQQAAAYAAEVLRSFGFEVETPQFECIDWEEQGASLRIDAQSFSVFPSPYSLGCRVSAPLTAASTIEELESLDAHGKLLLLHGEIAAEQLMPKNFPFFNPEAHQRILQALEKAQPEAVIAATARNPQLAGALYPFPLIEDGDVDIPSVYMTEKQGEALLPLVGKTAVLRSDARRIPSTGHNVIARKGASQSPKVVVMAHIDTKINTPGAIDNAAGVIVLLLLGELLKDYAGELGIEIFVVNGEDYYGAPGEILYLAENQETLKDIVLAVNIDAAGYYQGRSEYSLYLCPEDTARAAHQVFTNFPDIVEGEPWYQSDHSVFIQQNVPAMAITSEAFMELSANITHTPEDRPELMDANKVAGIALALHDLVTNQFNSKRK